MTGEITAPPLEPRKVPDVADGNPEKLLEPYHYGSMKAPIVNGEPAPENRTVA